MKWSEIKLAAHYMSYLAPVDKGADSGAFVKDAYEVNWAKTVRGVEQQVAKGEPLAKIVLNMDNRRNLGRVSGNKVAGAVIKEMFLNTGADYTVDKDKVPFVKVGVINGRYAMLPNIDPVELLAFSVGKDIDHVVELGSGRGNNLATIFLRLGRRARRVHFYALEYTEAGRKVSDLLAGHEPDLNLTSHPFDWTAPDLSCIPPTGKAIVYSLHSAEQAETNPALYEQIAAREGPTTLIHFEPVGWQRVPEILAARRANDISFYHAMIARRLDDITSEEAQILNHAINAWRMSYNTNLLECVRAAEKAGLCEIVNIHYDFTSWNPVAPITFIQLAFPNRGVAPAIRGATVPRA